MLVLKSCRGKRQKFAPPFSGVEIEFGNSLSLSLSLSLFSISVLNNLLLNLNRGVAVWKNKFDEKRFHMTFLIVGETYFMPQRKRANVRGWQPFESRLPERLNRGNIFGKIIKKACAYTMERFQ